MEENDAKSSMVEFGEACIQNLHQDTIVNKIRGHSSEENWNLFTKSNNCEKWSLIKHILKTSSSLWTCLFLKFHYLKSPVWSWIISCSCDTLTILEPLNARLWITWHFAVESHWFIASNDNVMGMFNDLGGFYATCERSNLADYCNMDLFPIAEHLLGRKWQKARENANFC